MHNQSIAEHHINNDGDAVTLTPVSSSGQYQTMPTIATTICGDELQSANSESVTSAPVVADVASTPAPVSSTTAFQSLDVENLGKFPSCLAQNCRFVCWRDEIRNGNPTKIPVDPHTGRDAESDNPMTWGTLTEAVTYYEGRTATLRGVGRMFHLDDGIIGVDFDDCLDEQGNVIASHVAAKWLPKLNSYCEVSPSGRGVKVWLFGNLDMGDKTGRRDSKRGVEIYQKGRYFTVTGKLLPQFSANVEMRQAEVEKFFSEIFGEEKSAEKPVASSPTMLGDAEIIRRASEAKNGEKFQALWAGDVGGYGSPSEADMALCAILWFWTGDREVVRRLFGQSTLGKSEKWNARLDYQEATLNAGCNGDVYSSNVWSQINYRMESCSDENGSQKTLKIARPFGEVTDRLVQLSDSKLINVLGALYGLPDQLGGDLCALESPVEFWSWLGHRCLTQAPGWDAKTPKSISKEAAFCGIIQKVPQYAAIETAPQYPSLPKTYYNYPPLPPPNHAALTQLLDRFNPETPADRVLILSMLCTSVWGGTPGQRPGFAINSRDGKGVGKSTLAEITARLLGQEPIQASAHQDMADLKKRLFSGEGLKKRVVLFDNETGRISNAELAAMITARAISGHRMYHGEAQRPNTLLWIVTMNTTGMDGDLADRNIPIFIVKPRSVQTVIAQQAWVQATDQLIEQHRWGIISALIDILKRDVHQSECRFRWALWASEVMAKAAHGSHSYAELLQLIMERQHTFDIDADEVHLIEDKFQQCILEQPQDMDTHNFFFTNEVAARLYQLATGSRVLFNTALRNLKDHIRLGHLPHLQQKQLSRPSARGLLWTNALQPDATIVRITHVPAAMLGGIVPPNHNGDY